MPYIKATKSTLHRTLVHPKTRDKWQFIWFIDESVEDGRVLVRHFDLDAGANADSGWRDRQDARDIWSDLVTQGYSDTSRNF